jgi:hypothetical protein
MFKMTVPIKAKDYVCVYGPINETGHVCLKLDPIFTFVLEDLESEQASCKDIYLYSCVKDCSLFLASNHTCKINDDEKNNFQFEFMAKLDGTAFHPLINMNLFTFKEASTKLSKDSSIDFVYSTLNDQMMLMHQSATMGKWFSSMFLIGMMKKTNDNLFYNLSFNEKEKSIETHLYMKHSYGVYVFGIFGNSAYKNKIVREINQLVSTRRVLQIFYSSQCKELFGRESSQITNEWNQSLVYKDRVIEIEREKDNYLDPDREENMKKWKELESSELFEKL